VVRGGGTDQPAQVKKFFATTRPKAPGQFLVTLGVTNNSPAENAWAGALFQVGLHIGTGGDRGVLPYPDSGRRARDSEEESLDLLYRLHRTYAVGHGCAVDWSDTEQDSSVGCLWTNSLPEYEVHSITPEIKDAEGNEITVEMVPLAGLVEDDDGTASLERLVTTYEEWIKQQRVEADGLSSSHRNTAHRHLALCEEMSARMRAGLHRLTSDTTVKRAFQLANKAILEQQIRQGSPLRKPEWDADEKRFKFPIPATDYDPLDPPSRRGRWRPFQIAFILATLCSAVDPEDPDREVVDLLFFPTGGGKTEAYLGLTAFTLYHRRLLDPDDRGTHVLMRYTLRLLTAQQFQRAASLICAMELERQQFPEELGEEQFRIGIWVGKSTTPNSCKEAVVALKELKKSASEAVNKFVVIRCPWCNAQIGPVKTPRGSRAPAVVGYKHTADTVRIHCSDNDCAFFSSGLPVDVIDEEIYERPPAMLIATVDKFARLAWIHTARSLFGFGPDGTRTSRPPGLIIQDELHLISGPLGSMVGLYETLIEDLCTAGPKPKIVSSTATIRRFEEQVHGLFARDRAAIFPPHGIEAEESFFATVARDENGKPKP
ncbi:MAG: helicase, partial [Verrucomicrobiota bacterium]|nr:helicase [Verrucomicrobiota bacterium]